MQINAKSLAEYGITLTPSTSTEFQGAVSRVLEGKASPQLEPLLPFCVIVKNLTNTRIIAYTVRWTMVDQAGRTTGQDSTFSNLLTMRGGNAVEPNEEWLVSPGLAVKNHSSILSSAHLARTTFRVATSMGKNSSITISLDAVVFEGGKLVGPDESNTAARLNLRAQAAREVLGAIMDRRAKGDSTALIVSWLQELAKSEPSPAGDNLIYQRYWLAREFFDSFSRYGESAMWKDLEIHQPLSRLIVQR